MSDSSLSDGHPSDATLEQALRNAVRKVYKSGKLEELTVKRIRKSTEGKLDLQDDFFKNDSAWKEKSKDIIQSEVDAHADANASSQQAPSSPPTKKQSRTPAPKPPQQHRKIQGTKRASGEDGGPRKRRKRDIDSDEDDLASDTEKAPKRKPITKVKKRSPTSSICAPPKEEDELEEPSHVNGKSESKDLKAEQSESEMSEVLDEAPKPKKGSRKSGSTKPKTKKTESSKAKKASEEPGDPDVEEIKRLQSWLVKCGIRKMWYRELAPYSTPRAKIHHLKDMLAEVGMTGRYSAEKSNQIREERELKADLEAVQEGAQKWGKTASEDNASTSRPRRGLAKGLEGLDFLNDSDGEETD